MCGSLEAIEAVQNVFHGLWDGYGGECSLRLCDIIGIPVEDGSKVLHQESPYEDLYQWAKNKSQQEQSHE